MTHSPRAIFIVLLLTLAWPASAAAFCGFYVGGGDAKLFNEATQVVLMRHGTKTVLSMQNNYEGPATNFAMVVPVPIVLQEANVKTLPKEVFDRVDMMTAPRLVEYWEQDPCYRPEKRSKSKRKSGMMDPSEAMSMSADVQGSVKIEAEFKVAEYDVVVLSATESTALDTWLKQEKYNIPAGAEPYLRPYVESGMYFFVARVDVTKVAYVDGKAVLSPLRFAYDAPQFSVPVRLGMINSKGHQDLLVYILAQNQRYEVANYDNVFIPTNIEVRNEVRDEFGSFYRTLFDRTAKENPAAVVTEYSWAASTCDPCPGPTIDGNDFNLLGADELTDADPWGFTITRLHARYTKDEVGEDLVFVAAPPVMGGREVHDADGALEKSAKPGSQNNFQGRYIIRHEWAGEAKCSDPQYGVWGGPSGSGAPTVGANPSQNTAGAVAAAPSSRKLPDYLKHDIVIPKASRAIAQQADTVVRPTNPAPPAMDRAKRNRCSMAGLGAPAAGAGALLLVFGVLLWRRRR